MNGKEKQNKTHEWSMLGSREGGGAVGTKRKEHGGGGGFFINCLPFSYCTNLIQSLCSSDVQLLLLDIVLILRLKIFFSFKVSFD